MKITALVENTSKNAALKPIHGLSIYIETQGHKVLFDLGPNGTLFKNAAALGIDLQAVDTVVISHGHGDHGGALRAFLDHNGRAKIYVRRNAFAPYYSRVLFLKVPVGLDARLRENDRFVFVDDALRIDDELFLFSDVEGQFDTDGNRALFAKNADGYVQDDFSHEQSLIITEGGKTALFSACSHRGIANIMRAAQRHQPDIEAIFGGFHLFNPVSKREEPLPVAQQLAKELSQYDGTF